MSHELTPLDEAWWTPARTEKVVAMIGHRTPVPMIAGYLGVDPEQLTGPRWEEAAKRGEAIATVAVDQALFLEAKKGRPAAVKMWRERGKKSPYDKRKSKQANKKREPSTKPALNPRQEAFARHYALGGNASQAAIDAGYSQKTAGQVGHRLLKNVEIQKSILQHGHRLAAKVDATEERVMEELAYIGFADLLWFVKIDPESGEPRLDLRDLPDGASRALSEITIDTKVHHLDDGSAITNTRTKVKLSPKTPALELLGRKLAMWIQRHEHAGPGGGPIEVEQPSTEAALDKITTALEEIRKRREQGKAAVAEIPESALPTAPVTGHGEQ